MSPPPCPRAAAAGVYFEKFVKGKLGQTLWIRNLQLSIYGAPLSLIYALVKDGRCVRACVCVCARVCVRM